MTGWVEGVLFFKFLVIFLLFSLCVAQKKLLQTDCDSMGAVQVYKIAILHRFTHFF